MKIIRLKLPEIAKFNAFTVSEYRDMLVIRNDMNEDSKEEQQILDDMLEELYPEYNKLQREYIFVCVLLASIGKDRVEATFTCPKCNSKRNVIIHLKQEPLSQPTLEIDGITLYFNYPSERKEVREQFFDCIDSVGDGDNIYKWDELSKSDKDSIKEIVTFDKFTEITKKLTMIDTYQTITCCEKHEIKFNDALSIFKMVVNPEEIFAFYKINHAMTKHEYNLSDIMSMLPYERSIILTLIEKDIKCNNDKATRM